jgi:hypothetical protein
MVVGKVIHRLSFLLSSSSIFFFLSSPVVFPFGLKGLRRYRLRFAMVMVTFRHGDGYILPW